MALIMAAELWGGWYGGDAQIVWKVSGGDISSFTKDTPVYFVKASHWGREEYSPAWAIAHEKHVCETTWGVISALGWERDRDGGICCTSQGYP